MTHDYDEFVEAAGNPHERSKPLKASELARLDVNEPNFQERLKELAQLEEISEQMNISPNPDPQAVAYFAVLMQGLISPNRPWKPDPALQAAERVAIELRHVTKSSSGSAIANHCAQHVYEWFKDKNPHHIDMVMMTCSDNGIEPTPTIIKLAAKVATSRVTSELSGTSDRIIKENVKGQVFRLMLNLIHTGATLSEAADKAAQWRRDNYPNIKDFKASSLNKEYTKHFRKADQSGETQEEYYFKRWDKYKTEATKDEWERIRKGLPLAEDDLLGTRR